jgi:hypothetical protein
VFGAISLTLTMGVLLPAQNADPDLEFLERAPSGETDTDPGTQESILIPTWTEGQEIRLEPGATMRVERILEKGNDRWLASTKATNHIQVASLASVAFVTQSDRGTILSYFIRVSTKAKTGRFSLQGGLLVRDENNRIKLQIPVRHSVTVFRPASSERELEALGNAFRHHQKEAKDIRDALPRSKAWLSMDALQTPSSSTRLDPAEKSAVHRFLEHRLFASTARDRILGVAESPLSALQAKAVREIGGLTNGPSGTQAAALAVDGLSVRDAIEKARLALDDLDIDTAEGFLEKLRKRDLQDKHSLALVLRLLGAVHEVRGRTREAEKTLQQALCLEPKLQEPLTRPYFHPALTAATQSPACKQAAAFGSASAMYVGEEIPSEVRLRIQFGPDPYELVSGGFITVFGPGGGRLHGGRAEAVTSSKDRSRALELRFEDPMPYEKPFERLFVSASAVELSGTEIFSTGSPHLLEVRVGGDRPSLSEGIPWWVWAVAGGVAVAGGTVLGVVLAGSSDGAPNQGIGPIGASF